jgi:hypothetical protein
LRSIVFIMIRVWRTQYKDYLLKDDYPIIEGCFE